jgi:rRNA maturation endonuclease Nob1
MWPFKKYVEKHGAICPKCGSDHTSLLQKRPFQFPVPVGARGLSRVKSITSPEYYIWRCKNCKNIFKLDN